MKALSILQPWAWAILHRAPTPWRGMPGLFDVPDEVARVLTGDAETGDAA